MIETCKSLGYLLVGLAGASVVTAMLSLWIRFIDISDVPQTRFLAFDKGDEQLWHYMAFCFGSTVLGTFFGIHRYYERRDYFLTLNLDLLWAALSLDLFVLLHPDKAWFFLGLTCSAALGAYGAATLDFGTELYDQTCGNHGRYLRTQRRKHNRKTRAPAGPTSVRGDASDDDDDDEIIMTDGRLHGGSAFLLESPPPGTLEYHATPPYGTPRSLSAVETSA